MCPLREKTGLALLTALVVVLAASSTAVLAGSLVLDHFRRSDEIVNARLCLLAADFAVKNSMAEIAAGGNGTIGVRQGAVPAPNPTGGDFNSMLHFEHESLDPKHFDANPGTRYFTIASPWGADGADNNGNGQTDEGPEAGVSLIWAFAQSGQHSRAIEAIVRLTSSEGRSAEAHWTVLSWRIVGGQYGR